MFKMSVYAECNILKVLGAKLGMEGTVIMKSEEYFRLCFAKSNLDKINDVPKAILCLDLSARNTGVAFDKAAAVKLSTLPPVIYQKYFNLIETSLEITETLTVAKLCVKINCSEAQDLADHILSKYQAENAMVTDLRHPQYVSVAVYTACKLKELKVSKVQLRHESRLRPSQWKQLENKFLMLVKQTGLDVEVKRGKKKIKGEAKEILAKVIDRRKTRFRSRRSVDDEIETVLQQIASNEAGDDNILEPTEFSEPTTQMQPLPTGTSISSQAVKKKRDNDDGRENCSPTELERLEDISANTTTASKKFKFDIFGQTIAAQLNNLPITIAIELQLQIQQLINQRVCKMQLGRKCSSEEALQAEACRADTNGNYSNDPLED